MNKGHDEIKAWANTGTEFSMDKFEALPDIPLYMDQITALISDKLSFFGETPVTGSMINNYVKAGVIPHPEKKKYSKEQLSSLIAVFLLKQVLSMQDIKTIFDLFEDKEKLYRSFSEYQTDAINDSASSLRFSAENGDDLILLALKFSAEANAKRAAAEKILSSLKVSDEKKKK